MILRKIFSSKVNNTNKINIEYDLQCTLECISHDQNNSSFILKNINGSKKMDLLGSDVNEMDLNLLFSDNFRQIHNNFMVDILRNREKSKFWNFILSGKMNRMVNIINPINKFEYIVKLKILFNSQDEKKILFDIIFTDVNIVNKIMSNTVLLSHDLKTFIKSAQNIATLIENNLNSNPNFNFKNDNENLSTLKELLNEAYTMCSKSTTKLTIENIYKKKSKMFENVKIYLEIPKFLKKISNLFTNVQFNLDIKTNICISSLQNDVLLHLILNIIKNSTDANSTKILIILDDNEDNELLLYIKDNGNIISDALKSKLFSVKFSQKNTDDSLNNPYSISNVKTSTNIEDGFILAYYEWKNLGGFVNIISNEFIISNEYEIKIKGIYQIDNFTLNKTQLKLINDILQETNKKIILLIDDSLLNLKLLSLKMIRFLDKNYKHSNFPILTPEQWQSEGIIQININDYIILLLANGMYGKDISIIINPNIIITDIQMPQLNGIQMLKFLLANGIQSKLYINSAFSNKDDEEINELIYKYNITFIEKGGDMSFIEKLFT